MHIYTWNTHFVYKQLNADKETPFFFNFNSTLNNESSRILNLFCRKKTMKMKKKTKPCMNKQ